VGLTSTRNIQSHGGPLLLPLIGFNFCAGKNYHQQSSSDKLSLHWNKLLLNMKLHHSGIAKSIVLSIIVCLYDRHPMCIIQ